MFLSQNHYNFKDIDGTMKRIRSMKVILFELEKKPWRFCVNLWVGCAAGTLKP